MPKLKAKTARERAHECAAEAHHGRGRYCYAELVAKITGEINAAVAQALAEEKEPEDA